MTWENHPTVKPNSCAHSFHSLFCICGRQPPRWPQWSHLLIFTLLCNSLPFRQGWAKMLEDHIDNEVYKKAAFCLVHSCFLPYLLWWKLALWRGPRGMELREASSPRPVRKWGPQFNSLQGTESCQQPYCYFEYFQTWSKVEGIVQ